MRRESLLKLTLVAALALLTSPSGAPAAQTPAAKPSAVEVFPVQVQLTTLRDHQSLVVQATYPNGITREVTLEAQYHFADPSLVEMNGNVLTPAADGKTELTVTYEGHTLKVPVTVAGAQTERPISFRLDVMPVFAKAGCNSGSCHGSASGKDGFRLSLFGFDPAGDYYRLTRELSGRRINLALPRDSLLLTKATGQVSHTGGELFTPDSPLYATLARWLEAGARPDDEKDVARVTGIKVMPEQMVLDGKGARQRLTVRATYSDGTDRDVTSLAAFITSNESSAAISEGGVITAGLRGEAFVMARFGAFTVGSQVIVLPKGLEYDAPEFPANNYIDTLVADKLKKLRITPSELCSDEVFLRRATIDIIGKLPTAEEYRKFTASTDPDKREKLVDDLLGRKEFVELWVMKFAELLQIRSSNNVNLGISYKASVLYYNWLKEQFADNVPMDQVVRDLLASSGSTFTTPQTNFYQVERDTKKLAENVAQVFMGTRLQCAQCHNHPFDRWTMDDYYGFVAFFSKVGRKGAEDPRAQIIFDRNGGEVKHPVDGRVMKPTFLGGATPDLKGKDRRAALADWLASPQNPYFAENLANIVWAHFFGRGIVDPVDDVRVSNPPSNPELLETLGQKFTGYDYDFKKLVRDICTSRTYQLSTQTNETNKRDLSNFSHAYIRRMRAEVLYDAISQVTGTMDQNKFRGLPRGSRAVQIADGRTTTYFLTTFGRATRETVCSCEVVMEPNLSQALHLINGKTVNQKVRSGGVVKQLLDAGKTPTQVVEALYIRAFSRDPTDKEIAAIQQIVGDAKDPRPVLQDVFWALLNSKEFIFNH